MSFFNRWKKANGDKKPVALGDRVRVYDIPTGTITLIPARELAPGMVQVEMQGIEGVCWVNPSYLNQSPYQHPPFDEETRDYLRQIMDALDEVYPQTLEQWEDGFRRDRDTEREIAIWLHIAEVYDRLTAEKDLAAGERQDVFRLLLACANNPRERVLATAGVQTFSRPEAEAVVAEFYRPQKDAASS